MTVTKHFEEFITKRCEEALLENENYNNIEQSLSSITDLVEYQNQIVILIALIESACYKKGFFDARHLSMKECNDESSNICQI